MRVCTYGFLENLTAPNVIHLPKSQPFSQLPKYKLRKKLSWNTSFNCPQMETPLDFAFKFDQLNHIQLGKGTQDPSKAQAIFKALCLSKPKILVH